MSFYEFMCWWTAASLAFVTVLAIREDRANHARFEQATSRDGSNR